MGDEKTGPEVRKSGSPEVTSRSCDFRTEAVILIGHNSPVPGAGRDMQRIAAALARGHRRVSICTVDRAETDLPKLVAEHAAAGATQVVVLPWLLQLGRHLVEDIPRAIAAARAQTPGAAVILADPLGYDDLLVRLAERRIVEALDGLPDAPPTVHLVGAGPGDPGMVTVRARELVATCDCLIHDRLVPAELVALAPADAEIHAVGKHGWGESCPQETIDRLMLDCIQRHRRVVRLKGGDPMIFGRAGEELALLAKAGVDVEVVPGITSVLGTAAALQLPLTLRGSASSLALVAGQTCADSADWKTLAHIDTVVLYMGLKNLARHCGRLVAAGRAPDTPACAVQSATCPAQRVVAGTLADLAQRVAEAGLKSPVLVIVGDVVALGPPVSNRPAWRQSGRPGETLSR